MEQHIIYTAEDQARQAMIHDMSEYGYNTQDGWVIENEQAAAWAMRKLAEIERERARAEEVATAEIERIKAWTAEQDRKAAEKSAYFEAAIQAFYDRKLEEDPKYTLKTPDGSASYRKQPAKWEYDDAAVIAYMQERGMKAFLREKVELAKAELKKAVQVVDGQAVDANGEIIDGIRVTEQPQKFAVKF